MKEIEKCFLCGYDKATKEGFGVFDDKYRVICPRCGTYWVTKEFLMFFEGKKITQIGYILSGLSRELREQNIQLDLNTKNAENYAHSFPAPDVNSIEEKANKFLQRLRYRTKFFGEEIEFGDIEMEYPLAYAKNSHEFVSLLSLLREKSLIKFNQYKNPGGSQLLLYATLLAEGWDLTNKLATVKTDSKQGFIAIWFDDSMDETIAAIGEGISAAGFTPICIKGELFPERIMDKALSEIRKSRFVVIDLTGDRPSVFFEAGFAHGLGIEPIYVFRKLPEKDPLEFYVRHYQCYEYKEPDDLKDIVKNAVTARIGKEQI